MTRILFCSCKHEYQDQRYGAGKRVHNQTPKKPDNLGGWACSVCGKIRKG